MVQKLEWSIYFQISMLPLCKFSEDSEFKNVVPFLQITNSIPAPPALSLIRKDVTVDGLSRPGQKGPCP